MSKRPYVLTSIAALVYGLLAALVVGVVPAFAQNEGTLSGVVYYDKDADGVRDEGEEGLSNIEVKFDSGGWNTTLNTDAAGKFTIPLNPATWTVSVNPPDGYDAPKGSVEAVIESAGDTVDTIAFGLVDEGEVLPAGGAPIPASTIIAGLFGLLAIGLGLVAVGQYRSKHA